MDELVVVKCLSKVLYLLFLYYILTGLHCDILIKFVHRCLDEIAAILM